MKFLVIGGNPAGMSAAARVRRRMPEAQVIVLEKTHEVSYGACGLPYYIAGLNNDLDLIRIRKADEFISDGVDLRLGCTATGIDYDAKTVSYTDETGGEHQETYDKLLIASGTSPSVPPFPGVGLDGVCVLKTLQHAEAIRKAL